MQSRRRIGELPTQRLHRFGRVGLDHCGGRASEGVFNGVGVGIASWALALRGRHCRI